MGGEHCIFCRYWPGKATDSCPETHNKPCHLWASNCTAFKRRENEEKPVSCLSVRDGGRQQ
jgi:hypothetical protein